MNSGIRQKLVAQVCLILLLAFAGMSIVVLYVAIKTSNDNFDRVEKHITESLIAKGETLTKNNGEALASLIRDKDLVKVRELISSTVANDKDIRYGAYVDNKNKPWVIVSPQNPIGRPRKLEEGVLMDDWVSYETKKQMRLTEIDGAEIYLFFMPVFTEGVVTGTVSYGLSAALARESLKYSSKKTENIIFKGSMLIFLAALAIGSAAFFAVKKLAYSITKPLINLSQAVEKISEGERLTDLTIDGQDEVGLLSEKFQAMQHTIFRKIEDLKAINAVGEKLATAKNDQEIASIVLNDAILHCGAHNGTLIFFTGFNSAGHDACFVPEEFYCTGDMDHWNNEYGEIYSRCAKEAANESTIQVSTESIESESLKVIVVPILDGESTIGTIIILGHEGQCVFEDTDVEYFQSVSNFVVVSHHNVQMREQIEEHNRDLESKINDRTAQLQKKNNDISQMMEHMHQGLFVVLNDRTIHEEYSRYLEKIFATEAIAGRSYQELVFHNSLLRVDQMDNLCKCIDSLIGEDELTFDANRHILIGEITYHMEDDDIRVLQYDWAPILSDGFVDRIMVTVKDITLIKRLQADAERKSEELELVGQVLNVDADRFSRFLSSSNKLLDDCVGSVQATSDDGWPNIELLLRGVHTIKGNSRSYNLEQLVEVVHQAEDVFIGLKNGLQIDWSKAEVLASLFEIKQKLQRYRSIHSDVLQRDKDHYIGKGQVEAIKAIVGEIDQKALDPVLENNIKQIKGILASSSSFELSELISDKIDSINSIAEKSGKLKPIISVQSHGLRIDNSLKDTFNAVLLHSLYNSIDHGIEVPEERCQKGKAPQGIIIVEAEVTDDAVVVKIGDDGKGLDVCSLRKRLIEENIVGISSDAGAEELGKFIFLSGISTANHMSDISGRGVGMDAVKKGVEEKGGAISLNLKESHEANFCPFELQVKFSRNLFFVS